METRHRNSGRIAHLILQPRFSGAEILVRELASRQCEQWDKVAVIALLPSEEEFLPALEFLRSKGVEVFVPDRHLNRVESLFFFRKAVAAFRPSCIFAHSVLPGFYARGSFLLLPCPMVTVLHDGSCQDYHDSKLSFVENILTHRLSALIAVNPRALESYAAIIRDCASISHVIPNGIALDRFSVDTSRREAIRESLGIDPSCKLLLQVGRINRVKRQHLTVRAARHLALEGQKIKILFAGIIEDLEYQKECVREAGDLDVHFLGSRSDIPQLMNAADILLMPSFEEAHSVAFLEALASGKPVVASRIPSFLPYEFMDGVRLVDPETGEYKNSISHYLDIDSSNFPRDMSEFTIDRTCEAYNTVAHDLIANAAAD